MKGGGLMPGTKSKTDKDTWLFIHLLLQSQVAQIKNETKQTEENCNKEVPSSSALSVFQSIQP